MLYEVITQFDMPICIDGHVDIDTEGGKKRIRINRIHMEEDAGNRITSYNVCYTKLLRKCNL